MTTDDDNLATKLLARAAEAGGDTLLEEAAILAQYVIEAGQNCIVQPNAADHSYGVIYTSADLIGAVIRVYDTGARTDSRAHTTQLGAAASVM